MVGVPPFCQLQPLYALTGHGHRWSGGAGGITSGFVENALSCCDPIKRSISCSVGWPAYWTLMPMACTADGHVVAVILPVYPVKVTPLSASAMVCQLGAHHPPVVMVPLVDGARLACPVSALALLWFHCVTCQRYAR